MNRIVAFASVVSLLLTSFACSWTPNALADVCQVYEEAKEFSDDVVFEKIYTVPGWGNWKKDYTWIDTGVGDVKIYVELPSPELVVTLPARINASFDTVIEPEEENDVDMLIETYNGADDEFKFVWRPIFYGRWSDLPLWLRWKFGKRDRSFLVNKTLTIPWEDCNPIPGSSFTFPPRSVIPDQGTSDDPYWEDYFYPVFSVPIDGTPLVVNFQVEWRLHVHLNEVQGSLRLQDEYATLNDTGSSGAVLNSDSYSKQFSIKDGLAGSAGNDGYVDFCVKDLNYTIDYAIDLRFRVGVGVGLPWWAFFIDSSIKDWYYPPEPAGTFDSDEWTWLDGEERGWSIEDSIPTSVQLDYTMSRPISISSVDRGIPIFDIGRLDSRVVNPEVSFDVDVPIRQIWWNKPVGATVSDTTIQIYNEDGTMIGETTVLASEWDQFGAYADMSVTIDPSMLLPVADESQCIDLRLIPPNITSPSEYGSVSDIPSSMNATLTVSYGLPDLQVRGINATLIKTVPFNPSGGDLYKISVDILNGGKVPCLGHPVDFWVYYGLPPSNDTEALIEQSQFLDSGTCALSEYDSTTVDFYWPVDSSHIGQNITFACQLPHSPGLYYEEIGANNVAFTTSYVEDRTHDVSIIDFNCTPLASGRTTMTVVFSNDGASYESNMELMVWARPTSGNDTRVYYEQVDMSAGDLGVRIFQWTTSGSFIAWANISVVEGEGYVPDNALCYIIPAWDLNGDLKVDMRDVAIACRAFGTEPGDERWNPIADVNGDYKVDMRDIGGIARHFGQIY